MTGCDFARQPGAASIAPVRSSSNSTAGDWSGVAAIRSPRHCWPMACIWSADRSSIIGRAASCRLVRRNPTRWSRSIVALGASRRICEPRRSNFTAVCGPAARTAIRHWRSISARSRTRSRRCFPAGFYYKTFMWPRAFWRHVYEPAIRAAAGLGRAPSAADPDRYLHHYAHCDVLVIGAGPAGLAAALAAATGGKRIILCDEQAELGGSLLAETGNIEGKPASAWLDDSLATLRQQADVTLLPRTTAFGWFPDNMIGLVERITDHIAEPDPRSPTRAALARAGEAGGARHRGGGATAGIPWQ